MNCFGQLNSAPIGWNTLARNGVFLVIAGVIAWTAKNGDIVSLVGWLSVTPLPERVLAILGIAVLAVLAVETALLLAVLRQQGRVLLRFDALDAHLGVAAQAPRPTGLPPGTAAPKFALPDLEGKTVDFAMLLDPVRPLLLVFVAPNCGPCEAMVPAVGSWIRQYDEQMSFVLVSSGSVADNIAKYTPHGIERVLLQRNNEVAESYQAFGTPSAVLVNPIGQIASFVAMGADAIAKLVMHSVPSSTLKLGDEVPPLKLIAPDESRVQLTDLQGIETLLLFWDPDCGFCQAMVEDLKKWETRAQPAGRKLLVISTGTAAQNSSLGLHSPIVRDPDKKAATTFGASGTPMAILIDAHGKVASDIAAGAPAVMELALSPPLTTNGRATIEV